MSLNFAREYKEKLVFADQAAKIINSGDWIKFAFEACLGTEFDHALAMRKDELRDVRVSCELRSSCFNILESSSGHFCWKEWSHLQKDRRSFNVIMCSPVALVEEVPAKPFRLIFLASVSPMNKKGYFSFGVQRPGDLEALEMADCVMVEVNENIPGPGSKQPEGIHISRVDFVIVGNNSPLLPDVEEYRIDKEKYGTGKLKKKNPGTFVSVKAM